MLKKTTVDELADVFALCVENMNLLAKKCQGIIRNELKAKYDGEKDSKNQETLVQYIEAISDNIITTINEALRAENTEKLRGGLIRFLDAVQGIFQASLDIHLAHDFDQEKGEKKAIGYYFDHEQGDKQAKGVYFEIHRKMIALCERAKSIVHHDRDLKGEFGRLSIFTESLTSCIKSLSGILGYKVKESKKEKIVQLEKPPKTFYQEYLAPKEQGLSSPKRSS